MKKLNIIAVCGFGVGSSMVLKMKIEEILKEANIAANVQTADVGSASSTPADIIFTSNELGDKLSASVDVPVVIINNFVDKNEIREKGLPEVEKLL
ncbi:PTS sugar transporter subunit IIB [Bacillus chungangensis]|jgi:ascorbate PTS system EIIB component|uniref:PTS system ascorbate-specific IIB component n=1 Tax=Bacillus chungangensis TaxID=587633 RepID=A0ABT9WQK9_9BACI|nr:PTS sugar transporter subunit IIB [Bacillus chungangensis]MDQ0175490.1 PTS system ascorbate-specific IIB component [Bacillus chungangensis]